MQPNKADMYTNDNPYTFDMDGPTTMTTTTTSMNVYVARAASNTNTTTTTDTVNHVDVCTHTNIMSPTTQTGTNIKAAAHPAINATYTSNTHTHMHNNAYDNTHDNNTNETG